MGYDWDDKLDICRRLYVDEKRTTAQIIDYFRHELKFEPSKRAFEKQFQRWGFPSKIARLQDGPAVVERLHQLWEKNMTQKDMVDTLRSEGHDQINERTVMRLRAKHGLLLRNPNPAHATPVAVSSPTSTTDIAHLLYTSDPATSSPSLLPPTRKPKRDLQAEDSQKWQSRKRRRHTRTYAGLPADEPGPPRYPSETTIGECQTMLRLDNRMYKEIRDRFRSICLEKGIVKKTACGPEVWDAAKSQLIAEDPNLSIPENAEPEQMDWISLSLDVICMDVTKHMRIDQRTMTLAEAKNLLGVNPGRSQDLRAHLLHLLASNNFVNKHESLNWSHLKTQWLVESGLTDLIAAGSEGPERDTRARAVQMLYRDYMKRWRDAVIKTEPDKAVAPSLAADVSADTTADAPVKACRTRSKRLPKILADESSGPTPVVTDDPPIDPSLLQAAQDSSALVAAAALKNEMA